MHSSVFTNNHRSEIKVNTNTTVSGPTDWTGFRDFTHGVDNGPAAFSQSLLNDGSPDTTIVTVSLPCSVANPPCRLSPTTHDILFTSGT